MGVSSSGVIKGIGKFEIQYIIRTKVVFVLKKIIFLNFFSEELSSTQKKLLFFLRRSFFLRLKRSLTYDQFPESATEPSALYFSQEPAPLAFHSAW